MAMNTDELMVIDLSSVARPLWEVSGKQPDPDWTSREIVARVRALASEYPHAAICCDSGKSFRKDIDPTYKANRGETPAPYTHQVRLAQEQLKRDGFPVWSVPGFEADDLIAASVARCLEIPDTTALIVSSDKDLLALVGPRVTAKSVTNGSLYDEAMVMEKLKVKPSQVTDYLSLVGDASDNVKGAAGIGGVRAAALLAKYGTLDGVYAAIDRGATPDITPAQRTSLQEFRPRLGTVRQLVALRTDVPIPFEEIAAERVPVTSELPADWQDVADPGPESLDPIPEAFKPFVGAPSGAAAIPSQPVVTIPSVPNGGDSGQPIAPSAQQPTPIPTAEEMWRRTTAPIVLPNPHTELVRAEPDWDRQLEPRSLDEAAKLAAKMFASRLFSAYGTYEGIFTTIIAGRELGMPAMASLRAFHIIEGKPSLSADAMVALVMRSGKAKYFKCTQRTDTVATFKTLRVGEDEEPMTLLYSIDDAKKAWKKDQKAWDNSGYGKNPADMLVARAKSKLARLVYPDVVGGLYAPEEME